MGALQQLDEAVEHSTRDDPPTRIGPILRVRRLIQPFQQLLPVLIFQQEIHRLATAGGQAQLQQLQAGAGAAPVAVGELLQQMLGFTHVPTQL